ARMAVSTLHHQFRALTAMSPLQFQKQLRLQAARQRMLMHGIDATSAAYEVGYESVSQFSREYSRYFGQPPRRDITQWQKQNKRNSESEDNQHENQNKSRRQDNYRYHRQ
ncbi:MAG: helix-turn-helix transcriptional regulator, partial [Acidobacteria bacterium]|nr:helix-turn-helix transcriptional regulator [Acidobacteriota bacterium]